jgi:2-methylisocitrate lyase-like PEP mutase family enzyme
VGFGFRSVRCAFIFDTLFLGSRNWQSGGVYAKDLPKNPPCVRIDVAAHGYEDGESIPLSFVEQVIARIAKAVKLPVTVDAEGGYSDDPDTCAENIERLVSCGAVGINFEDRFVSKSGLHTIEAQCVRIAAIRHMADARGIPLFINARTDLFLGTGIAPESGFDEAVKRAMAYAKAGASGILCSRIGRSACHHTAM